MGNGGRTTYAMHYLARLVDYGDCFHDGHFGGVDGRRMRGKREPAIIE